MILHAVVLIARFVQKISSAAWQGECVVCDSVPGTQNKSLGTELAKPKVLFVAFTSVFDQDTASALNRQRRIQCSMNCLTQPRRVLPIHYSLTEHNGRCLLVILDVCCAGGGRSRLMVQDRQCYLNVT